MTKDRNSVLKAGPLWDFDWGTFGPYSQGWRIKNAIWYSALFRDPAFVARVKEKWAESRADFAQVADFIDQTADKIRKSNNRNIRMWPIPTTWNINGDEQMTTDEATARLRKSYTDRLEWMTTAIEQL